MKNATTVWCAVAVAAGWMATANGVENGHSILSATGVQGGLVVHIGCGDGTLTTELCQGGSYLVRGLSTDPKEVEQARRHVRQEGLYGQVSIGHFDGSTIPLIDDLATLIVAKGTSVPMTEVMRVLHPHGVAYIDGRATFKPKPDATDEWTHYLHGAGNNAVAHDSLIGPPRHMQFLSDPLWSRHHDRLASISSVVTAKGRLFYIMDNGPVFAASEAAHWTITARNAFNGVFLWQKPIESWTDHLRKFRSGPVQLQRLLVTDGDQVLVTLGLDHPVSVLDAATGDEIRVLQGTEKTEEFVLSDGILYVLIGTLGAEHALIEQRRTASVDYQTTKLVRAVSVESGETLWQWPTDKTAAIMSRTLASAGGSVYFQENGETVCLNAVSGKQKWRTNLRPAKKTTASKPATSKETERSKSKSQKKARAKGKRSQQSRSMGWTFATLVVEDGVVLSCDGITLLALDALRGDLLWQCPAKTPFGKVPSVDILVVNGVVWTSPDLNEGRALRTGEVVSSNQLSDELVTAGHHHRCYRNKATDRYVIQGYRGLEFRDTQGENHCRHNWIRGICQYGIMPANGMVYLPPHNCGCYPEAKLFGFWTLKSNESSFDINSLSHNKAIEKGPAYNNLQPADSNRESTGDWPMHRYDPQRSGVLRSSISTEKVVWNVELDARLSAPVIAGDTLLVAAVDRHEVLALDANTGAARWSFSAAGPIDSPPTIHADRVLVGSADGFVYCLCLADGELIWKLCAAPTDRMTVALQQVESLWPVHGSILVVDGVAYFAAGRSSYIDGGLFLYGLDPMTGTVLHEGRITSPTAMSLKNTSDIERQKITQNATDYKTQLSSDHSDAFSMSGNISDILVSDGEAIYLRHMKFDKQLKPRQEWTHHLLSTSMLLDPNEAHRSHWFYGNGDFSRLPVAYEWLTRGSYGGFSAPLGKFLVFDDKQLWGAGWGKMALYKSDISNIDVQLTKDFPQKTGSVMHQELAATLPIHPRAMIKAAEVLYLAGYPSPSQSIVRHAYGRKIEDRGLLLHIDAVTGTVIQEVELPASPMFDGMAAANGKLYVSLENNSLMCLE